MFSILFAAIVAVIKDGDRIFALGFFYGFDSLTWFIVIIQVQCIQIKPLVILKKNYKIAFLIS